MAEEIKEIIDFLKDDLYMEGGYKSLHYKQCDMLLNYITVLQQEVNKLTAESTEWESKCYDLQEENKRLKEEIDQLTNNWNELRQHIKEYLEEWENSDDEWVKGKCDMARDILYDMEEIKEDNNEKK